MKLAEQTPLTGMRLAELALEAGFPDGVINVLNGMRETTGAALVAGECVVGREVGEVQQEPQVETRVAQRDLDALLAALPEDLGQVLDVIGLHPVVTVADEPERVPLANLKLFQILAQPVQNVRW